jgi:hypothetical protein
VALGYRIEADNRTVLIGIRQTSNQRKARLFRIWLDKERLETPNLIEPMPHTEQTPSWLRGGSVVVIEGGLRSMDWELVLRCQGRVAFQDKSTDDVVQRAPKVVQELSKNHRESDVHRLGTDLDREPPGVFVELPHKGVWLARLNAQWNLSIEHAEVLGRSFQLGAGARKVEAKGHDLVLNMNGAR